MVPTVYNSIKKRCKLAQNWPICTRIFFKSSKVAELWTPRPKFGRTSCLYRGGRTPDIATTLRPPFKFKKKNTCDLYSSNLMIQVAKHVAQVPFHAIKKVLYVQKVLG